MRQRTAEDARDSRSIHHNVGTLERWGSLVAGSALVAYGLGRRSRATATAAGAAATAAGAVLLYRGATGHCHAYGRMGVSTADRSDTRRALAGPRGFHVLESVRIERPVAEVYRFWRNLENLPRFMKHLETVVDLGNGHSHWVAKGPAGLSVEWDAEIINDVPNKVIGWRSLPHSDLVTAGSVNFDEIDGGRATQLTVHLQYAPPGGRLGKLVAQLFGDEPSQAIREDLQRLETLLESGAQGTDQSTARVPQQSVEARP